MIDKSNPAVWIYPGGREVCTDTCAGRLEYKRRREKRWKLDKGICCLCGEYILPGYATTEHPDGRGLGGSKRNDAVRAIRVSHYWGNSAKGSMHLNKYLELPLVTRISNCRYRA